MLLTRLPLSPKRAFDLHVLSLPPAFVLSQDQTLKLRLPSWRLVTQEHPFGRSELTSPHYSPAPEGAERRLARNVTDNVVSLDPIERPKPSGERRRLPPTFLFLPIRLSKIRRTCVRPGPSKWLDRSMRSGALEQVRFVCQETDAIVAWRWDRPGCQRLAPSVNCTYVDRRFVSTVMLKKFQRDRRSSSVALYAPCSAIRGSEGRPEASAS